MKGEKKGSEILAWEKKKKKNLPQAAKEIKYKSTVVAKEVASYKFLCKITTKSLCGR